ncbi:MAG: hypothetical protein ABH934_04525 [Chloroflexota bacterium]
MKATEALVAEFIEMHNRYRKANERMLILQASVAEGMRKIGEGCTTEESKAEFATLQREIEMVLARMREICESLQ